MKYFYQVPFFIKKQIYIPVQGIGSHLGTNKLIKAFNPLARCDITGIEIVNEGFI
jgi:hypothetical protein